MQGPISRLLSSCRQLASSSSKVALFCCFAGTHAAGHGWGQQHWQQFLLLLHATKRLVGGPWKALLRDWASPSGARLPLQCVHDLLANVYNVSDLADLQRLPALLSTKHSLLSAAAAGACTTSSGAQERGSVAAAVSQLVESGPCGVVVDLDDLLLLLMCQFGAGAGDGMHCCCTAVACALLGC